MNGNIVKKQYMFVKKGLFLDSIRVTGKCSDFMLSFGQTDGLTERQTPVKQYAPYLSMLGHKTNIGLFQTRGVCR